MHATSVVPAEVDDVPISKSADAVTLHDAGDPVPKPAWAFGETDAIKDRVRESLLKAGVPHHIYDDYWQTGIVQQIAKSPIFENLTLAVITANAIWIAVDTDWNTASLLLQAHPVFIVAENLFCVYFSGELIIRFLAFRQKRRCLNSGWFVFDAILVFFMVTETWIFIAFTSNPFGDNTAILRLFRLLRLTRLMKMFKSMPQLMILIKGMVTAMQAVTYVFFLLVVFTYVFAIMVTQLTVDNPVIHEKYFDTVPLSMYSLLIYGTFLDALSDFCDDIRAENPVVLCVVMCFIGLSAMTIMNMLIGVLCAVIDTVAETEKETLMVEGVIAEMREILGTIDANSNGQISIAEMKEILQLPSAVKALDNVGVDPVGMMDFAEMFFMNEQGELVELEFDKFMEMVLDLRASNNATLKDVMNLGKQVNVKLALNQKALEGEVLKLDKRMTANFERVEKQLSDIASLMGHRSAESVGRNTSLA
eukprot:TRINITY_DN7092_c0_g1_i1.p1 TRINITY_DN7092_c0_g1~~TRINITY_DN7092_c0_g1_i1.p1  ORF type:complete len:477 (-),score=66.77 TRINITY_DN7092_c0_g1_i1:171-1601(-)